MSSITEVKRRRVPIGNGNGEGLYKEVLEEKTLYDFHELPEWQQDNDKILTGYIRETKSVLKCVRSLFIWNNETVNIYTHLVSAVSYFLLMLGITDLVMVPHFPTSTFTDYSVINFYLLGAFGCLMCSSCFHTFKQHSGPHSDAWSKVDYMGIIVLITCSMISLIYYGFFDHMEYFRLFTVLTLTLATACTVCVLSDKFNHKDFRPLRAGFFIAFGLSGVFPVAAGIIKFGIQGGVQRVQLKYLGLEAIFYIAGALIYGFRIPETMFPGRFDFWGHSHQIFHVLVVIASFLHLKAVMGSYIFKHSHLNGVGLAALQSTY
ncbi:hypothetical protein ZYGR_0H01130 [Zygosaccharomyces rouxii]|uniref:ZYRO0B06556p n=2 Tax=Zygosaccharomyces rouxii TaxID=4956 RepID=C5DR93_ZYGRC|nr:uncharacterized protein ZYRO0B06556g [Zygosaccharomyces rouxii]KAH9200151.1 hemolysin-III related-domain-containing protein [Zygosaccharomyces rouxii]GAV47272.1 hypothetical protein ZYGR_0H01130 [Zygosaccharomyces rouxii]CAR26304.1 ZYRO0B06556p [Zygosaccharomyces rouxii]